MYALEVLAFAFIAAASRTKCDYVLDRKEQFEKDPIGFFAFADHFYDMTKRAFFNVWGKLARAK
ncbi:MAG: hypothetical protein P4L53_05325 [Candidatus Obscuribacterales bacterium]|nr:hypothetical protein [Candidatus Obscuribacterales bacterium]